MSDPMGPPLVDIEALAALNFDRWETDVTGWSPPTNLEWSRLANPHLVSVRLAWVTLQKSKEELIEVAEELGDQALMELVSQIGQSADWFRGLHKMLECAETRIMCAYAALNVGGESGD
jgi:formylglycine-generating enzyme required for sulfatase activity